jgi:SAM-dependent methyltransferase
MDVDEESRRFGKKQGLRIEAGDYRDLQRKFGDKHFDVVFMMHVLEHIPRPSDALGAIIDMISPGGLLIIRVPDQDSLPSRIKRVIRLFGIKTQEWGFVQPPIHLHGYSIRTFKALAKAHQLEIVRLEKTSPLDELNFPATARYWHGLQIQRQIYKLGESFGSGGHLAAVFQRTH